MPPEQEPPTDPPAGTQDAVRPTGSAPPGGPAQDAPDQAVILAERRRKTRRLILIRLSLLGVSSAGVASAAVLWVAGRGGLALRVIAGDLLAVLFVLLLS